MPKTLPQDIPIGDIEFFDNYIPALDAGNWKIKIDQSVEKDSTALNVDKAGNAIPIGTTQEFVVSAPQFSIPPADIVNQFPPTGSTGLYGEVLPHIVLSDALLPWERKMDDSADRTPWLALLVLQPEEITGPQDAPTMAYATTAAQFLAPEQGIVKPTITKEDDIADGEPCFRLRLSVDVFQKITPRQPELRFLTHCRAVNTGDKATLGMNQHGLFSVVVANRFSKRPASSADPALKSIVHLVSMEGLDSYLVDAPDFGTNTAVDLLSLASWTFQTLPDNSEDFRGLVEGLVSQQEKTDVDPKTLCSALKTGDLCPDKSWLRLPATTMPTSSAGNEANKRLSDGFVPLELHTRTGEDSFAWYRGPLTPVFTTELQKSTPFVTGDAALIYDPENGVFDMSLAAAWEIGRAVALSDKSYGQKILDFRRNGHRVTDNLLHRLQSAHFTEDQIEQVEQGSQIQDNFLQVLNTQLLSDVGASTKSTLAPSSPPAQTPTDPKAAVATFLKDPDVQSAIMSAVKRDLDPISTWLAKLLLLYPVPFNYLVPDARALPVESLRFFYLDRNWQQALLDGALSIGLESSRQTFFHSMTHGLLHDSAFAATKVHRDILAGIEPSATEQSEHLVSGFLLRSALVSGWPNLAIRPRMNGSDELLKILRLDHLSPSVMLCLVDGVPDYFEFSEPQESFRFGIDDDGNVPLRNLVPPTNATDADLGVQLPGDPMLQIRDLSGATNCAMRTANSRVLNIAPQAPEGLLALLTKANQAHSSAPIDPIGPGSFALQMVKSPEAIKFMSQTTS